MQVSFYRKRIISIHHPYSFCFISGFDSHHCSIKYVGKIIGCHDCHQKAGAVLGGNWTNLLRTGYQIRNRDPAWLETVRRPHCKSKTGVSVLPSLKAKCPQFIPPTETKLPFENQDFGVQDFQNSPFHLAFNVHSTITLPLS